MLNIETRTEEIRGLQGRLIVLELLLNRQSDRDTICEGPANTESHNGVDSKRSPACSCDC